MGPGPLGNYMASKGDPTGSFEFAVGDIDSNITDDAIKEKTPHQVDGPVDQGADIASDAKKDQSPNYRVSGRLVSRPHGPVSHPGAVRP
jgi:hypothetical protein